MGKEKTVICKLSYLGTRFCGFARQKNQESVEQVLLQAIYKIFRKKVKLVVAGRTDKGVHAVGQIVSFRLEMPQISESQLTRALNGILPEDVRIIESKFMDEFFNARSLATSRIYIYNVVNGPESLFLKNFSINVEKPLNLKAMRQAARFLVGKYDFSAFSSAGSDFKTSVREVKKIIIKTKSLKDWFFLFGENLLKKNLKEIKMFNFVIEANAFLYKMCRYIVGFLLEVGLGRIPAEVTKEVLNSPKGIFKFRPAPARGLILLKVNY